MKNTPVSIVSTEPLPSRHYNFGLFYERLKNMREAHFHFNEAKKKAADNPELLRKIEESISKIDEEKDIKGTIEEPDMPRTVIYPVN